PPPLARGRPARAHRPLATPPAHEWARPATTARGRRPRASRHALASCSLLQGGLSRGERGLEGRRTDVVERRVAALGVVEGVDVVRYIDPRRGQVLPVLPLHQLLLERPEERLRDRVVPAVAL